MNDFEIRWFDQEIRELLSGTVLSWLLDEVDSAIADGVPEERILRRRRNRNRNRNDETEEWISAATEYETVDVRGSSREYAALRKTGQLVITTRPMTSRERLQVLLDALSRVLIELPEIESTIIATLGSAPGSDKGTRMPASGVTFEPDEARHPRDRALPLREPRSDIGRLREIFTAARNEVAE